MIENSTLRTGGNTIGVWFGQFLVIISKWFNNMGLFLNEKGEKVILKNKPIIVTNPSSKLYNPFTLGLHFTVGTNEKYQITLEGDYKKEYKECENGDIKLTENEMFMIINQHKKDWFKKE